MTTNPHRRNKTVAVSALSMPEEVERETGSNNMSDLGRGYIPCVSSEGNRCYSYNMECCNYYKAEYRCFSRNAVPFPAPNVASPVLERG